MSVYIKDMEMPTEGTVIAIYRLKGKFYASMHRGELCPLVPVPDHGDLVDKQRMAETNEQYYKVVEGEPDADYARKVVLRMLDQAPIVIPADKEAENE